MTDTQNNETDINTSMGYPVEWGDPTKQYVYVSYSPYGRREVIAQFNRKDIAEIAMAAVEKHFGTDDPVAFKGYRAEVEEIDPDITPDQPEYRGLRDAGIRRA